MLIGRVYFTQINFQLTEINQLQQNNFNGVELTIVTQNHNFNVSSAAEQLEWENNTTTAAALLNY